MAVVQSAEEFIWAQKYRPKTIDECVLPDNIKKVFHGILKSKQIPHLLLSGSHGMGKTTVAMALCEEIGADYIYINASKDSGIDTLRTDITRFATSASFFRDAKKVVILDEADHLQANSFQPAFRGFMEMYSSNCTFIMTCNCKNRIIAPIRSRCQVVDFKFKAAERPEIASKFMARVEDILRLEGVKYDKRAVAETITHYFPDFRRVLNELQQYAASGSIDIGILASNSVDNYKALFDSLKTKKFGDMRKWVAENSDNDSVEFFTTFFQMLPTYMKPEGLPASILLLAQYQFWDSVAVNKDINTTAFLTEVMMKGDGLWK